MASKAGIAIAVVGTVATPPTIYYTHKLLTSYIPAPKAPVISIPTDAIPAATLTHNRNDGKAFETQEGCIKAKFPKLGEINSKINASSTTKADSVKTSLTNQSSEAIDGCLNVDLRWRNSTDKQHAISGTLEMTLTRGTHGLIFRTLVTNLLDGSSALQFINQAFRLTKQTGDQWKIDHGYLWTDEAHKSLSEAPATDKSNLIFGGLVTAKISYRDLCTRVNPASGSNDQKCNQLEEKDKSFDPVKLPKKKWTKKTDGKEIFEHLSIKAGKEGSEKLGDLWGNKGGDLFGSNLDYGLGPYLYEENNGFFQIENNTTDKVKPNLTKWFEPFKGEKGDWS